MNDAMAAKAAWELAEGTGVYEGSGVEVRGREGLEVGGYNGGLEGGQLGSDSTRREGAHVVARAGPDAEAEEEVKLVRGRDSGPLTGHEEEAEAVEGGSGTV